MFKHSIRHIRTWSTAALALAGALSLGAAQANQLFVQDSGTAPAGGDPNLLSNPSSFVIGAAGGTFTMQNPLLVVVGLYDGMGTASISFSSTACTPKCPLATVGTYGLTSNTATMTSASKGDAFGLLGLTSGGSENFSNWSTYDTSKLGLTTPTSFTLYTFAIDTSLASGTPITVGESGASAGSFILAYGCQTDTKPNSVAGICANGDVAQTVFTNTGAIGTTSVPEPGVLALMAIGLFGLGWTMRRRRLS